MKRLIDEREQLQKKLSKNIADLRLTHKESLTERIKVKNTEIHKFIEAKKLREEAKALKEIKTNPAVFYKYANSTRNTKVKIGPLKQGQTYESGPKKMADILSQQFKSVFSTPQLNPRGLNMDLNINDAMNDIELVEADFRAAIRDMNGSSTPGPDGVRASVYKDYVDQLAYPIMKIWRLSLDTGRLPEGTALAVITPIYKLLQVACCQLPSSCTY